MRDAVAAGLGNEVLDGQRCFRALLEAMSRPGRVVRLGESLPVPPAALAPASYAFLLALADFETSVWLDPEARRPEVEVTLRFRCGCPLTTDPAAASFAVVTDPAALPSLESFAQDTPEYPDRSTTIVLQVADLGTGETLRLRGPGMLGEAEMRVSGARPGLWADLRANRASFPQGVDSVLVAGERVAALPRSTLVAAG